jgi:3-hydroxybutyryl-CoA dehydrogenase/5-formyl-3-hydroxy-2-methylpyridine 4-carboxylate dehydrogenase
MSVPKVAAVIGAGTMGPGMAAVLARAGSEVRLYDISDEILERAKGGYQMATGALDRVEAASAPGGSVAFSNDLGKALAGAELVLEAIPEKLDLSARSPRSSRIAWPTTRSSRRIPPASRSPRSPPR